MSCRAKNAGELDIILSGLGYKPRQGKRVFLVVEPERVKHPWHPDDGDDKRPVRVEITHLFDEDCKDCD